MSDNFRSETPAATAVSRFGGFARLMAAVSCGYVAGTLPSSRIAVAVADRGDLDLAVDGTGNPGGMNTSHLLGKKWGAAVTFSDMAKAVAAARFGRRLAGDVGANLAASAAVIGHCYPPGRKGGKGIATSIGQVAATFPIYMPVDVAVGVGSAALPWFRQRTRMAAAAASATWVGFSVLWWRKQLPNPGGVEPGVALPAAALVSSLVIAQRFRAEMSNVDTFNQNGTALPASQPPSDPNSIQDTEQ